MATDESLSAFVERWRGESDIALSRGGRLVHRWPQAGESAYLHELYPAPTSADLDAIRRCMSWQELPRCYNALIKTNNGARMFLGTISLAGFVEDFNRAPGALHVLPASLCEEALIFRTRFPTLFRGGWQRIGTITTETQWYVLLKLSGEVATANLHGRLGRRFADVWSFLRELGVVLEAHFSEAKRLSWRKITIAVRDQLGQ
jgi:hypothetical protein